MEAKVEAFAAWPSRSQRQCLGLWPQRPRCVGRRGAKTVAAVAEAVAAEAVVAEARYDPRGGGTLDQACGWAAAPGQDGSRLRREAQLDQPPSCCTSPRSRLKYEINLFYANK